MPAAVVAVNDLTAVGVIKGLLKAGCRVPQDVSVTGFDNTRLADYSNPSIPRWTYTGTYWGRWRPMLFMNSRAPLILKARNIKFPPS